MNSGEKLIMAPVIVKFQSTKTLDILITCPY